MLCFELAECSEEEVEEYEEGGDEEEQGHLEYVDLTPQQMTSHMAFLNTCDVITLKVYAKGIYCGLK